MNSESNDYQWLTCHKSFDKRIPRGEKGGYQSKIKWGNNCGRKNQFEYLRQCCVTSYEDKGMTLNQPPPIKLCSFRFGCTVNPI